MKSMKRTGKKAIRILSVCAVLILVMAMPATVQAGERTYKITFRAGSHGTVKERSSYGIDMPAGSEFDKDITEGWVQWDKGYYFTGWNEELKPVTQNTVYVAQYSRIVEEAVYRVNYVDANGNAVATQKVAVTNEDAVIWEAAPVIEGYIPEQSVIKAVVPKKGIELTFRYQPADSNVVTEEETVVVPGQENTPAQTEIWANTNTDNSTAAGTQNPVGTGTEAAGNGTGTAETPGQEAENQDEGQTAGEVNIADEEVPLGDSELEDEKVPLGDNKLEEDYGLFSEKGIIWPLAAGAAVIFGAAGFFIWRARKRG